MPAGYHALTEKEKQTLRLIVRGHDAKSTARHLGLSVHTINERLRDARRKLGVSSSREAARLVLETEGATPENSADEELGEAGELRSAHTAPQEARAGATGRFALALAGVVIMSLTLGVLALASLTTGSTGPAEQAATSVAAPASSAESEAVGVARAWLELGDQGRWNDGWAATTAQFRTLNTAAVWAQTSTKVRVPLGAVRSRALLTEDFVPAAPAGAAVVKFRTDFANKAGAIETVSLAREEGAWKVVGVYLD